MSSIVPADNTAIMERVLVVGDLDKLTPAERVNYYMATCKSLGLNPLTKPFDYIKLNGKLTLYATKVATDDMRSSRDVSVIITSRERIDSVFVVAARATDRNGRTDESTGVVSLLYPETVSAWEGPQNDRRKVEKPHPKAGQPLHGDDLANAMMKAETKAKRRVTLSIVGLGWLDETEIETIRDARPVQVDAATGEIVDATVATITGNGKPQPAVEPMPLATPAQLKRLNQLGSQFYGSEWDTVRHDMAKWVSKDRTNSSKELTQVEADTLIRGIERKIEAKKDENARAAAGMQDHRPAPTNGDQASMLEEAAAANEHSTWGAQAL